jgi:hypothetical protein
MTEQRVQARLQRLALALIVLLVVSAIAISRAPFLHDFAEWLYQAQILRQMVGDPGAVSHFELAPYPVPNALAPVLLALLSTVFPAIWAGKLYLIAMVVAWFLVIRAFTARFVEPSNRPAAMLVLYCVAALAPFFWYGFVSYQLGLLLLAAFLAIHRDHTPGPVVAAFGLALFFAHAMAFIVFVLFMLLHVLRSRDKAAFAGLIPGLICALWFIVGRQISPAAPQRIDAVWSGWGEALAYKAAYPAMLGPFRNFILPDGTSLLEKQPWVYWPGSLIWRHFRGVRGMQENPPPGQRWLALGLALLAVAYLLGPYHFFGLINPGGRLLIPMLLMAFILDPAATRRAAEGLVWPVALFTLISSGAYFYLMAESRDPAFTTGFRSNSSKEQAHSVFAFNERLYSTTRYKYFNFRVFAFAQRFEAIESSSYRHLSFRTGLLRKRQLPSEQAE